MKKHFLLLFLMALLPLAGWATDYEVQVTTYNGSAVWTGAKPAVQPGWFTAQIVGGGAVTGDAKTAIAAKLQVKDLTTTNPNYDAGAWDYQLELANASENVATSGGDSYTIFINSSTTATLTITKFMGALVWGGTLAFVEDELVYTGEPQALLQTGATATANGTEVPVVYATSATAENWVALADLKETNANTTGYTVYYKVVETDNYAGSDVQTMAGTKAIAKADNTISDLALAGWTYDPAKTAEPLATGENPAITFTATNDAANATFSYKKGTGEYGTWAEKVGGHAGSYTLKATIAESDNYKAGEAEVAFTIAKATAVLNVEGVINTDWTVYDGSTHQLFKQAATATVGESQTPVTVKYTYKYCPPGGSYDANWATARTSITNSNLKKTDAGRYRLNISVEGNDDYNGASNKVNDAFPVLTVAQADITGFTDPVGKTGLRVKGNNEAQNLVTEASWGDNDPLGTFQYKVGTGDWSADAPQGTTAGTYSVNFQIVPTDAVNYKTYTIAEPLSVTIAAKDKVTIATNANQTFGYGTTPVIEKTVTWSADHTNVDFSTAETKQLKWKWYDNAECSGDPLDLPTSGYYPVGSYYVKGYNAELTGDDADYWEIAYTPALVKITAGQVNATISGTATYGSLPTFTLTHTSGLSPAEAENFNAANNLSTVTVKKGDEVLADGVAKNADVLKTLPVGEYDLEATADIGGGQYVVFVTAGKLNVSAKADAELTVTITAPDGGFKYNAAKWADFDDNVTVKDGEATLTKGTDYTITYGDDTHDNTNAGTGIVKIAGAGNYAGSTGSQTFAIAKAALTIKADDFTGDKAWQYGEPEPTYTITATGLQGDETLAVGGTLVGIDGTLQVKRTSNETVGMHAEALVPYFKDADGNEIAAPVATNYTLTLNPGNLQVAQGAITIKLKEAVVGTYGDDPANNITLALIRNIANYELDNCELPGANLADVVNVAGVTYEIEAIDNNKYLVDTDYEFTLTGATSTNYAVTISKGTYKVNPADITLYAENQAIDWSADPTATPNTTVSATTVAIAAGALKCGDDLTDVIASVNIAGTKVGNNNITLTAATNANYNITVNKDADGNDKIGNLTVTGGITIALGEGGNDLQTITDYAGKDVTVTINFAATRNGRNLGGERNWVKENWVTLTLPFNITVAELSKKLGYAIVNEIDDTKTKVDGTSSEFYGKLTMKGAYGEEYLPANKPILVKIADNIADVNGGVINFGTQTIVAPATEADLTVDAGQGAKFVGTYAPKTVTSADDAKIWFMIGGGYTQWAYIKSTSEASWIIKPFEAFIDMSAPAISEEAARNMTFYFEEIDGSTTAIKSINVDDINQKLSPEGWYNLNGVKLQGAPTQKGVYIKDGKKFVIK